MFSGVNILMFIRNMQRTCMIRSVQAVILAAGKSQRFNTDKTKLTESICGQPMILYQTKLLEMLGIPTILVVGHQKEQLQIVIEKEHANKITYVEQSEQKGTGDALKCTRSQWVSEDILIMNGDVPLVTEQIIEDLCTMHQNSQAVITFVTAHNIVSTHGYGYVREVDQGIVIV